MKEIDELIKRFSVRTRMLRAWRGLAIGGIIGGLVACGLAVADLFGWAYTEWAILLLCVGICALIGCVVGSILHVSKEALADSIDRRADLKDRLRTAVERSESGGTFDAAIVADATAKLSQVNPRAAFPVRVGRWQLAFVLAMAIAAAIFLLGNTSVFLSEKDRQDREELKKAETKIERIVKPLLEKVEKNEATEAERDLAKRLADLKTELKKGRIPKPDAMAKANELAERAEQLSKERFKAAEAKMFEAQTIKEQMDKAELDAAGLENVDMSQVQLSSEELDAVQRSLEERVKDLKKQLENSSNMSAKEKAHLESELKDAQDALEGIKLSKKAKEFLEKLHSQPEFQELQEMLQKMQDLNKSGQQGSPSLTKEQVEEMIKELEALADKLKTDEEMREYLKKLMESLKEAEGG